MALKQVLEAEAVRPSELFWCLCHIPTSGRDRALLHGCDFLPFIFIWTCQEATQTTPNCHHPHLKLYQGISLPGWCPWYQGIGLPGRHLWSLIAYSTQRTSNCLDLCQPVTTGLGHNSHSLNYNTSYEALYFHFFDN